LAEDDKISLNNGCGDIFARNITTFSREQQKLIQHCRVTVIGCGGLGGYVIEELARTGVGSLTLCDPDTFSVTNINRQLNAKPASLGRNKARVAAKRIESLGTSTKVTVFPKRFQETGQSLFNRTEVVVDCVDTGADRLELGRICSAQSIPLVHGAVSGWYGQTGVQIGKTDLINKLYSHTEPAKSSTNSVIACTVALVASIQVAETCKILLGIPSPLKNNCQRYIPLIAEHRAELEEMFLDFFPELMQAVRETCHREDVLHWKI